MTKIKFEDFDDDQKERVEKHIEEIEDEELREEKRKWL